MRTTKELPLLQELVLGESTSLRVALSNPDDTPFNITNLKFLATLKLSEKKAPKNKFGAVIKCEAQSYVEAENGILYIPLDKKVTQNFYAVPYKFILEYINAGYNTEVLAGRILFSENYIKRVS